MSKVSRRALAKYAVDQLTGGQRAAAVAKHLAAVLIESGRSSEIESLLGDINWELENRGELVIGKVTTVHPLSAELEKSLKDQIKKITAAKKVVIEKQSDKSVIGGLKVESSSRVWDKTVAAKLDKLREAF